MKTTVKITAGKSLAVEKCIHTGGLILTYTVSVSGQIYSTPIHLSPDQWTVLSDAGDSELATMHSAQRRAA